MAEAIALGASIIAIFQIADRVIGLCKFYIETVRDAPSDLRAVLVETSAMKTILENVQFLISCDNGSSLMLDVLSGADGPVEGCRRAIAKMEGLFPSCYNQGASGNGSKRQKIKASLAALAWPLKEKRAGKLVDEVIRHKSTISLALTTDSIHDIKDIKGKTTKIHEILSESQRIQVYQWLPVTDPSSLHHRACKQYESGTGDWLVRSPEWRDWLEGKTRCVWVYGIPGAGKTVLASHLIENIKKDCGYPTTRKCGYVYYYCYFGHNQEEAAPFLRWTLNQLCRQADLVPTGIYKLYKNGGEPSLVELLSALEAILEAFNHVYVFIDAIDESMPRDDLLRVIQDLATDSRFQKVQLLGTSRQHIDIEKVMEQISVPVSMCNPLLDEDIRLYVRSQLHTNPKFKNWPPYLRKEALEALSTKAKGMFRWAACQIHVLQRLKCESSTVRNALANLPKTLEETYERMFSGIPNEDRTFVHNTLKWIYYHNELHGDNIPCSVLLQAVERNMCESIPSGRDYLYDEEVLRELCGCLITVIPEEEVYYDRGNVYKRRSVSFAHYTVWEFLNSVRILNGSAAFFAVIKEGTILELTRTVILEVLDTNTQGLWDGESDSLPSFDSSDYANAVNEDLNTYCVVSSIFLVSKWGHELAHEDDLKSLAFSLLDASKPHFRQFVSAAFNIEASLYLFLEQGIYLQDQFWAVEWKGPSESTEAALLMRLFQLDETCELAKAFLGNISIQEVLQTRLDIKIDMGNISEDYSTDGYEFEGSIIELLAQMAITKLNPFLLLLELGAGFFDPSIVLLSFVSAHEHDVLCSCKNYCPLARLLQLGATVNHPGYAVTPLQIAVARCDFEGLRILLEAGADPNGTGDSNGIEWKKETFLAQFNDLRNVSPLHIFRESKDLHNSVFEERKITKEALAQIDAILVQYGAKAFQSK